MIARKYDKYLVTKQLGPSDPAAQYFVLRIDRDPIARIALKAYAQELAKTNPDFAMELFSWVREFEEAE